MSKNSNQYSNIIYVNFYDLVSFQMKWVSVLPQQCILLMTCLLMALEAVPIDIDKTKVKGEGQVEGEKVENPVSVMKFISLSIFCYLLVNSLPEI